MMMYSTFSKRPLLLVTVSMMVGVLLSICNIEYVLWAISGILTFSFALCYCKSNQLHRTIALCATFVFVGYLIAVTQQTGEQSLTSLNESSAVGVLVENKKFKKNYLYVTGLVISEEHKSRVLIRLQDTCSLSLNVGSIIQLKSKIWEPGRARTPDGFDYKKYLRSKDIQFVNYSSCNDVILLYEGFSLIPTISEKLNSGLLKLIDINFSNSSSIGLVKGILLGCKDDMKAAQKEMFSLAGVGHVFAVSGMHVGMVYLLCWPLLFFRHRSKLTKVALPVLLLAAVWAFVLASGMTPSALRAGIMISLYEIGKLLCRKIDKWNILAATALISICANPFVIADIGFQFSYLALVGIFFFYSKMMKVIHIKNHLLNLLVSMIVLSFSAQLTLLPLSLYYFGNFSPFFWLSSLIAMLIVQLNFVLSFCALLFSQLGIPINFLIQVVDNLFGFLSNSIEVIMSLPGAALNWKPDLYQMLFGYQIILGMGCWVIAKSRVVAARNILLSIVLTIGGALIWNEMMNHDNELLIYDDEGISMLIESSNGVNRFEIERKDIDQHLIHIAGKNYMLWRNNIDPNVAHVNVVLIDQQDVAVSALMKFEGLEQVVITNKLLYKKRINIKRWCDASGIKFTNLSNGYLTLTL